MHTDVRFIVPGTDKVVNCLLQSIALSAKARAANDEPLAKLVE
jgi:hypothetical protein